LKDGRSLKDTDDERILKLAESILLFGLASNIQVWKDAGTVYCFDAHHRKKAFELLDAAGVEIPPLPATRCLAKTSDEAKRLLLLKESKSSWVNVNVVGDYMQEIGMSVNMAAEVLDLPGIAIMSDGEGWEIDDLEEEPDDGGAEPPEPTEPPEEPVTQPGEIWLCGDHRVMCGDAASMDDVKKVMCGKKADMVFTDPPYGVSYVGKTKDALTIKNDDMSEVDLKTNVSIWFDGVDLATRDGAYIIATVAPGPLHVIFASDLKDRGWLRQIMVWCKDSMVLGHSEYHYKHEPILFGWKPGDRLKNTDRTKTTVWDFKRPKTSKEHPTMKPVEMWEYGVCNHTIPGDLLFEPFGGSGTTLMACERTGRKCYSLEIDPKYVDVILRRWSEMTGRIPVRESDGMEFAIDK
jgi:site-specific DNA-methyltransferase (adenine-specific)